MVTASPTRSVLLRECASDGSDLNSLTNCSGNISCSALLFNDTTPPALGPLVKRCLRLVTG